MSRVQVEKIAHESKTQQEIAKHYNTLAEVGEEGRRETKIFTHRQFCNWVKSVLIQEFVTKGAFILDLCSGKGGDMKKWSHANASFVVFADHAEESIKQSIKRYDEMQPKAKFDAKFVIGDLHRLRLSTALSSNIVFDAVSCQFSLHYSFESEDRAMGLLLNASERLKEGGFFFGTIPDSRTIWNRLANAGTNKFGNDLYSVEFSEQNISNSSPFGHRYTYNLESAIDSCDEFLVPLQTFKRLANQVGLELLFYLPFSEFFQKYSKRHQKLLEIFKLSPNSKDLPKDQYEISCLYAAFCFIKRTPVQQSETAEMHNERVVYLD